MPTLTLLGLLLAAPPAAGAVTDPTLIRGVTRGALALSFDPAAAGAADGFELSWRTRGTRAALDRAWGLYATAPVGALGLGAGYEWLDEAVDYRRGTLSLGVELSRALHGGVAYRHLRRAGRGSVVAWDAALLAAPASFLSLAFGVEHLNAPRFEGARLERRYHAGAGLRPWRGAPWLTLGGEAEVRLARDARVLSRPRLLVELGPAQGLHLRAGYVLADNALWIGLSASLATLELGLAAGGDPGGRDAAGVAAALTLRARPAEAVDLPGVRTVEVTLAGDLRAQGDLFTPAEVVSRVPLVLRELTRDASVDRVILAIGDLDVGTAEVEELRAAVHALRAAGKHVTAELTGGSEAEYLVAAAADRIRLDPSTSLVLNGYAATLLYFADVLGKLGVRVEAVAIGRYKTGPDPLTRAAPRPEEREVVQGVLAQLYRSFALALAQDRRLEASRVEEIVARARVTPAQALALGLVDELSQPADVAELPIARPRGETVTAVPAPSSRWGPRPVIAVVPIVGNITMNGAAGVLPGGAADATAVVAGLEAARHDRAVRAVVLRIESPGGEVYAAEIIWRAVRRLAAVKPVVASMGNVAASGGYYVAAPAHVILAGPSTLTGSIGIFMVKPDLSGLLDLAGIRAETLRVGEHAAWSSPFSPMTEAQRRIARDGLQVEYEAFLARVAQGRRLPLEKVREIAEGRIYTGEQACTLGLVDRIGGLAAALAEAAGRAGVGADDDPEIRVIEPERTLAGLATSLVSSSPPDLLSAAARRVSALGGVPLARLPFEVLIEP